MQNGQLVAEYGQGSNYEGCLNPFHIQTTVTFNCNPNAEWEYSGDLNYGVSDKWLEKFSFNFKNPCLVSANIVAIIILKLNNTCFTQFSIVFGYNKVCPPLKCEAPTNNIDTLLR